MEHEYISIRRDRLLAASAMVTASLRPSFFMTLVVGTDAIASPSESTDKSDAGDATETASHSSFALTFEQASELQSKIDADTWAVIKTAAENVTDGRAIIKWSEIKALTGVTSWTKFAQGRLGGLHRSLRKIAGAPSDAILLWECDEGWIPDGSGDYLEGSLAIDGPAVETLRLLCGLPAGI
jgi:hypothetical protein